MDVICSSVMKRLIGIFCAAAIGLVAQDTRYPADGSQIPGPGRRATPDWVSELSEWQIAGSGEHEAWLNDLRQWRRERLIRMGYDDAEYRRPELLWTQRNFIQPQMMAEESYFYDPAAGKYTVDRYLDDVDKRYGGIDSVLIWPVYPNIGIDNRNQWDLARDLPGGIPALRRMVEDFHHRGVQVFFPSMPWDTGTRDVAQPYWNAAAQLMAEIGADGVNGDTFDGMPRAYRTASDQTGHPVAFEPEGSPRADEQLMWNNQSWGYWKYPRNAALQRAENHLQASPNVRVENNFSHPALLFLLLNGPHSGATQPGEALPRPAGGPRDLAGHSARQLLLAAGPIGMRQDHHAAPHRRLRATHFRRHPARRRNRQSTQTVRAQRQHRLPELRHLPPSHRARQRGVRPQAPPRHRYRRPCARSSATGRSHRQGKPPPRPTFRRRAPTRRSRPLAGASARYPAAHSPCTVLISIVD